MQHQFDPDLNQRLEIALQARYLPNNQPHQGAIRLFNGFYEGYPDLVADRYANTLLLYGYGRDPKSVRALLSQAQDYYLQTLPEIDCVLHKYRSASDLSLRRGMIVYGEQPAQWIEEHQVRYALDLHLNQDASFYPDTRNLRAWILENSFGKNVINLFAYTGSLGVAALSGGAQHVIQVDLKQKFLDVAQRSVSLNELDSLKMSLDAADFFSRVAFYKRQSLLFDLVILDAPFFSTTSKGSVDQVAQGIRLVNKVRPLVEHGGHLILVNNALFLSGKAFYESLQSICQDGYLAIDKVIPVPEDITGYPETIVRRPPVDPEPFNHPTKIVVMQVKRKQ